jgi:hypothetical protein
MALGMLLCNMPPSFFATIYAVVERAMARFVVLPYDGVGQIHCDYACGGDLTANALNACAIAATTPAQSPGWS